MRVGQQRPGRLQSLPKHVGVRWAAYSPAELTGEMMQAEIDFGRHLPERRRRVSRLSEPRRDKFLHDLDLPGGQTGCRTATLDWPLAYQGTGDLPGNARQQQDIGPIAVVQRHKGPVGATLKLAVNFDETRANGSQLGGGQCF